MIPPLPYPSADAQLVETGSYAFADNPPALLLGVVIALHKGIERDQ